MSLSTKFRILTRLLLVSLLIYVSYLPVQSQNTEFSFPTFTSTDEFITMGDIQYSETSSSFIINTAGAAELQTSCGRMVVKDEVRFKDSRAGIFASFSTSFTFSITTLEMGVVGNKSLGPGDAFNFWIAVANITNLPSYKNFTIACDALMYDYPYFTVQFSTYYASPNQLSDNHIGILVNNATASHTYNLCGDRKTNCSYLVNGGNFTAWIDYNATVQTLEVRLTNGSNPDAQKPVQPLIQVLELDLMSIPGWTDYLYVGLSGMSGFLGYYPVVNNVLSWSFVSSGMPNTSPLSLAKKAAIIFGVCGALAMFVVVIIFVGYRFRRRKFRRREYIPTLSHLVGPRVFTYRELSKATRNFNKSELIGSGGFGDVYKGTLHPSGTLVAVKRIKHESKQGEEGFHAEASTISQIRHRNLVQVQGWCEEDGHMLLVYDYMCNGSLNEWLFESRPQRDGNKTYKYEVMSWQLRHSILVGVAAALEYLHEEWQQCILHRDVKSSNVMLDADFNAHLGDFGLARLIEHRKLDKTTLMAGTLGYMAPEMPYTGKATKEADVYSFGILILEVICGRRPLDMQAVEPEDLVLLNCVWRAHEASDLLSVVDPRLRPSFEENVGRLTELRNFESQLETNLSVCGDAVKANKKLVKNLLHLGLLCCLPDPRARPSIRIVYQILQQTHEFDVVVTTLPPLPTTKPHGLFCSLEYSLAVESMSNTFSTDKLGSSELEGRAR